MTAAEVRDPAAADTVDIVDTPAAGLIRAESSTAAESSAADSGLSASGVPDPADASAPEGRPASDSRPASDAQPAPEEHPAAGETAGTEPEIFAERSYRRGDPEAAFAGAAQVIGGAYSTGIQEHGYSEAVGALVEHAAGPSSAGLSPGSPSAGEDPGAAPLFIIHTATQWPCHVSRSAAGVLGLDPGRILTGLTELGIPMDGKLWYPSLIASQAVLAAYLTRRNVRLLLNREEDFRYSPKRNASVTEIHSALGEKGEILGTRIDMTLDLGAQGVFTQEILDQSCLGVMGIAGSGALSLRARAIKTNIPPQGPFGGFGGAQGAFAMEQHLSRIADTLGQDPAEWRKNNRPGKEGLAGLIPLREEAPVEQLLDTVAAMAGYYRKWAGYELLRRRRRQDGPARPETLRGIGIAQGWQGSGFLYPGSNTYGVEVTLNIDGSLEIRTSTGAGPDFIEIWARIAREILAVEDVRVLPWNSALCPNPGPGSLSRNITTLSALIQKSCETIRNQRFRDPLPITVRETSRDGLGNDHQDKPRDAPPAAPSFPPGFDPPPGMEPNLESRSLPGWGAAVVELEIEVHSYTPSIRGIWLAVDGGRILSEHRARSSLKLAAIQALGWASREYLEYRGGSIEPSRISGYGISNPREIPAIHVDFLDNNATEPKGIGDLPFNCVPAAYVQAVSQAIDRPCGKIPLKPGDIWEILRTREWTGETTS
jgi:CO/xanthine dehydrogenase Mo-binding subunit